MLTVYHSNQLDVLKSLLCQLMRIDPLDDPFESDVILVQSPGMAQWLRLQLAEEFGIAANLAFPLPATFIWDMFICVLPGIPKQSAFSKDAMTWKLMTLLPPLLEREEFAALRGYLSEDDNQRKSFQLAARVADLFDQYLVYRPEWIQAWERGDTPEELAGEHPWQAVLWRELVAFTAELEQPKWHRANLYQHFIRGLEQATTRPAGIPPRLFIFGISALPPIYLEALNALSRHCDVHLMFTNPCRYYWGDIQDQKLAAKRWLTLNGQPGANFTAPESSGNPLLASMGKLGRDNLYLLAQLAPNDIDAFVEIAPDSLLHRVQADILMLEDSTVLMPNQDHTRREIDPTDRSIVFHACHSPMREVEVLHDQLLSMLADDPTLTPRDILVMVADINRYSPYIQAVFSSTRDNRFIPFSISDRSASQAHPILQAFLTLLSLPQSRFVAEDILALLEVPALAQKFAINEEGLVLLRRWVEDSGIRWGLDDHAIAELGLPTQGNHSWRFGVERMLLGYAMRTETGLYDQRLPYDEVSGLQASLVGQLADLLEILAHWRTVLSQVHTLSEWSLQLRELLNQLFVADSETEAVLALIDRQIQRLVEQANAAQFSAPLSLAVLRDSLSSALDNERISQRFLAGQVNFCTLMPMRSIPFRVVCLLGMNDGVYPRTLPPLGFDLMAGARARRGDRSRRDDDRYLFLEALQSAQEKLYISYVGRSVQDNSERIPSVLVSELLDYLCQSQILPEDAQRLAVLHQALGDHPSADALAESAQKLLQLNAAAEQHLQAHLVIEQALNPFSCQNFLSDSPCFSYAREWLPAARREGVAVPEFWSAALRASETVSEIELDALRNFYRHPIRTFFRQRLRVNFETPATGVPDEELFDLDGLARYGINQQLLNTLLKQEPLEPFLARIQAEGRLPYGRFGELVWQRQLSDMQTLSSQIREQQQTVMDKEVDLQLGALHLTGWLTGVQDDGLLRWRPGVLNAVDALNLWIEHLVYCKVMAQNQQQAGYSRMLGRDSMFSFSPVDPDTATGYLIELAQGYCSGLQTPLMLLPKSGWAWLGKCHDNGQLLTDELSLQKARKALFECYQGGFNRNGEGDDPYLQRLFGALNDTALRNIEHCTTHYLLPVMSHLTA
ncbi:exodeoxyribonuclease V subunit gamma [Plesiomonas sp.]|uniref:exodeoxyribonuclease V subunit gamma n=1 Tax=Plesiomonas sp. TaxID=2486279 RepID=UPI003F3D9F71